MIIIGDDIDDISVLKIKLVRQLEMKDLSYLQYFLGIEVAHSLRGYLLSQSKNIADILERARLTNNKTINSLIEVNAIYSFSDDLYLLNPTLYRTIGGSLVNLIITRPNITYVVHVVSKFVASFTTIQELSWEF
jgi:hypothetical protein